MYNLIGAVYKPSFSGTSNKSLNPSTWTPLTFAATDAANNVGMISNNDGIIINNSGSTVELNGSYSLHAFQSAVNDIEIVVGTSEDGVTWVPEALEYKDIQQRVTGYISSTIEYKVDVPNGYRVVLLAKTKTINLTLFIYTAYHNVYSTQGAVVPKLNALCTMIRNDTAFLVTSFGNWGVRSLPTIQGSEIVGASTSNGRITNTSGEVLVVDGNMHFVVQGSLFSGFEIFHGFLPFINGVGIGNTSWAYTVSRVWNDRALEFFVSYTVELGVGQYVDLYDRNFQGGNFDIYYRHFQHTMRSRT